MDKDKHKHDVKGLFSDLSFPPRGNQRGGYLGASHSDLSFPPRGNQPGGYLGASYSDLSFPPRGIQSGGYLGASHSDLSSPVFRQGSAHPACPPSLYHFPPRGNQPGGYLDASHSGSKLYDYLQLVLQWQPAVCSNPKYKCVKSPSESFTIHGFWPSKSNGAYVENWKQEDEFKGNEIYGIQAALDKCWPSMLGDNYKFWRSQWLRHGRYCGNEFGSQIEYFNRVVALWNIHHKKIEDVFRAQIGASNPQPTTTMKTSDIYSRMYNKFAAQPALRCFPHRDRNPEEPIQLQEVILCFDKEGKDLRDCPPKPTKNECPAYILFSMLPRDGRSQ